MTEKDVMFRVLYNPTTEEVYTNSKGNVYDFNSISELKTASKNCPNIKNAMDNGYEVFAVVENYTPILNSSFDDVFNKHYLVYAETFCCCDNCGKLFLQNDMSFTDDGAPYCCDCYANNEKYNTYFKCLGLDIVSRGDYESMSAPMYAGEFDDDTMTELAERIYLCLSNEYSYSNEDLKKYFNNNNSNELIDYDLDMVFWREMENIAIEMGMHYYEDMTDEEYKKICSEK